MDRDLYELALSLRDAHANAMHAAAAPDRLLDALTQMKELIEEAVAAAAQQEQSVARAREVIADQMNNFLMTVQTASDLLRRSGTSDEVRERLLTIVDAGRQAVRAVLRSLE